jgi:sterol desaturase/sphingolipid hydroxylase (fatty acid hydroxylase superfamily)
MSTTNDPVEGDFGAERDGSTSSAASPRLFGNDLLDSLTRVNRLVPLVLYTPIAIALAWLASRELTAAVLTEGAVAGYFAWTILEYFGHRFVFHHRPQSNIGRRLYFLIHGIHHDFPNDPLRLVMPPLMSAPIMAAAFLVFRPVCGPELVLPVLSGFVGGYVAYDMLHFHVHHGRARSRLGRWLQHRHMHHHFRDDTSWFSVSAPWWDDIFRTRPDLTRK